MRNHNIDIARFIGLAMIIAAHCNPPSILFQLRNFDVPLMVLVAGMSYALSHKSGDAYTTYLWKRAKRLVIPVWIFLTIYFVVLSVLAPDDPSLSRQTMTESYALIGGIGYVWIIKVLLLVALVAPFLYQLNNKITSNKNYFSLIAATLVLYEAFRYTTLSTPQDSPGGIATQLSLYTISYGTLFAIGLRMNALNTTQLFRLALVSLGVFVAVAIGLFVINQKFSPTQQFKYPPSVYYYAYALFVSCLLWRYRQRVEHGLEALRVKPVILFIAQNSIWVYLWHIPFAEKIYKPFAEKYVITFALAVIITYTQVWLVKRFLATGIASDGVKRNVKAFLTG